MCVIGLQRRNIGSLVVEMAPNVWEHCNKSTPKSTMFETPTLSPLGSLLQSGFVKREAWECVFGCRVTGCSGVTRGQLPCAESLNSPEPIPMAQSGTIWYITLHSWPPNDWLLSACAHHSFLLLFFWFGCSLLTSAIVASCSEILFPPNLVPLLQDSLCSLSVQWSLWSSFEFRLRKGSEDRTCTSHNVQIWLYCLLVHLNSAFPISYSLARFCFSPPTLFFMGSIMNGCNIQRDIQHMISS